MTQLGKAKTISLLALLITCVALASFFAVRHQIDSAGNATVSQPQSSDVAATSVQYSHDELTAYALSLINSDRQTSSNAPNVTLISVNSAQQHAEDMLKNSYFSHWDTKGYKPYVRYTLAGGQGAVNENIAARFGSSLDPKAAIKDLEQSMMNDDAEANWGHRNNILNPFHNKVGIGIAYDNDSFYMVQDFEDDYVQWTNLSISQGEATMGGTFTKSGFTIKQVDVYFDAPKNLSSTDLENTPYNSSYDAGTFVGSVADSELLLTSGIFVPARAWNQSGETFQISFSLEPLFSRSGMGIYTLRLWCDNGECLTNYSVFFPD